MVIGYILHFEILINKMGIFMKGYGAFNFSTFTCMHLADAFIQSDLQCIQAIHFFISMHVPGN